ncbi:restriction endonuclease subunit S domain-containing protein [Aliarcobacter cryaerophilus]|uniref:restriction endonuclease subunit S n=1 Tax=Aliarcobacter cryaerophilus TaxID=28198 RepID=UPI000AEA223F|nr:restriction endonuclease subunit S [Aliarcobacter cryaerophilus]
MQVLSDIAYITDGEHGSPDWDENSNIKYITAEHIKPNYIEDGIFKCISSKQDKKNSRARLLENDVLVYTVGAYAGYVAKAEKHLFPANIPRSVAIIRLRKEIKSEFLSLFMNSKYGYYQTQRFRAGNSQPMLALEKIKQFRIPKLSISFQNEIVKKYNLAYVNRLNSKTFYKEAEELLLKELDLLDFKPSAENIAIKSFKDSFEISGRLDSEYYQAKYDELIEHIKKTNFDKLDNIVNIKKSIEPGSEAYQDSGIPFIRVSNVTKFGITDTEIHLSKNILKEEELQKLYPKKDTILLSKDGTVGIAYKIKNETEMITSGALLHLMIKRGDVLPEYLTLVLNSLIVQLQAQRDAGGSIIQHWKPSEIQEILIPIIDISVQKQIEERIKKSFLLKEESKQLLDLAKKAVEIAIEKDENEAMKFMEEKIK